MSERPAYQQTIARLNATCATCGGPAHIDTACGHAGAYNAEKAAKQREDDRQRQQRHRAKKANENNDHVTRDMTVNSAEESGAGVITPKFKGALKSYSKSAAADADRKRFADLRAKHAADAEPEEELTPEDARCRRTHFQQQVKAVAEEAPAIKSAAALGDFRLACDSDLPIMTSADLAEARRHFELTCKRAAVRRQEEAS